jgi:hypothetical protein
VTPAERAALSELMTALDRILDVPYTAGGYPEAHRELALDFRVSHAQSAARLVAERGDVVAMHSMAEWLRSNTPEEAERQDADAKGPEAEA